MISHGGGSLIDIAGLTSTIADGLYIRKDGTSVTSAIIPFAQGIDITGTLDISNSSTPVYIHCPTGATVFGIRFDGGYSDGIRFDGAVGTTDVSISNLFAINDNSAAIPIANGKTFWSYGAAQSLGTSFNVSQMLGFLSAPFSTSLRGNYSGTLTDLIYYEIQPVFTVGTVTNAYGFHMATPNFSGCALLNFYGIYLPDISAGSSINRAIRTGAGQVEFGDNLIWTSDNSKDIGASGATRPRTGYFGTNVSSPIFTSTVTTGTAPLTVSSTTNVANLNASTLTGSAVGTSGTTIPLLSGTNTWSNAQTFTNGLTSNGTISLGNSLGTGINVTCSVDNNSSIGSSSKRLKDIFFAGNLGDGTITTTLANIPLLNVANTFTKSQTISMTTPTLLLTDTGGDDWTVKVTSGVFSINNTTDTTTPISVANTGGITFNGGADGTISVSAKINTYNTIAVEGYGVPAIVDDVALTGQTADIGTTNFTNAQVVGRYRISYILQDTTSDITAGAVILTISWTDGAGATTATATQTLTGVGRQSGVIYVQEASGNLTYATTHTGLFGSATYALYITCERVI